MAFLPLHVNLLLQAFLLLPNDHMLDSLVPRSQLLGCHVRFHVVLPFVIFPLVYLVIETFFESGVLPEHHLLAIAKLADYMRRILFSTQLVDEGLIVVHINDGALAEGFQTVLLLLEFFLSIMLSLLCLKINDGSLNLVLCLGQK